MGVNTILITSLSFIAMTSAFQAWGADYYRTVESTLSGPAFQPPVHVQAAQKNSTAAPYGSRAPASVPVAAAAPVSDAPVMSVARVAAGPSAVRPVTTGGVTTAKPAVVPNSKATASKVATVVRTTMPGKQLATTTKVTAVVVHK